MKLKLPSDEYVEKAKHLSTEETERLLAGMRRRFSRRIEDKRLSVTDALALQLEHEAEELAEWRARMSEIRRLHDDSEVKASSSRQSSCH